MMRGAAGPAQGQPAPAGTLERGVNISREPDHSERLGLGLHQSLGLVLRFGASQNPHHGSASFADSKCSIVCRNRKLECMSSRVTPASMATNLASASSTSFLVRPFRQGCSQGRAKIPRPRRRLNSKRKMRQPAFWRLL